MTQDARFEDAQEAPLNLGAMDAEDLQVVSSLVQDAVFSAGDVSWDAAKRRLVLLLNRFRWEHATHGGSRPERVRSLLVINNVLGVASLGIDRADPDLVLSLLGISWTPEGDTSGTIELTLAGDGGVRARVEAVELLLRDVTRPYIAPSGKVPSHDL